METAPAPAPPAPVGYDYNALAIVGVPNIPAAMRALERWAQGGPWTREILYIGDDPQLVVTPGPKPVGWNARILIIAKRPILTLPVEPDPDE